MIERYAMSGPEEGDEVDHTVLVIDEDGTELIEIRTGTLNQRRSIARKIAALMNQGEVIICSDA